MDYVTGNQRKELMRRLKDRGVAYQVYTNLTQLQLLASQGKDPQQIASQLGATNEDVLRAFEILGIRHKAKVADMRKVREALTKVKEEPMKGV